MPRFDAHDARGFHGAIAPGKGRSQGDGNFTEYGAGEAPAQPTLHPVDQFYDFELAGEDCKEGPFASFVDGKFSRAQMHVLGCLGETLKLASREPRKQRNPQDFVNRQHDMLGRSSPKPTSTG